MDRQCYTLSDSIAAVAVHRLLGIDMTALSDAPVLFRSRREWSFQRHVEPEEVSGIAAVKNPKNSPSFAHARVFSRIDKI